MGTSPGSAAAVADKPGVANRILMVDDDPGAIRMMARILADLGELSFATSGAASLRIARASAPDLILLDAEMPGVSGFEVCEALKADPRLVDVPVIIVTSHIDVACEVASFELGAADFIAKPVNAPLLRARVKAQLRFKTQADTLRRISTTDALTCIANRRRFDEALANEWRRARRAGHSLSLLMIDVDYFKLFNDQYGHAAGDVCLRAVARSILAAVARPADLAARYGGEEFTVLLPETSRTGASTMALAIVDTVRALDIAHSASRTAAVVTVSIGIACCDDESDGWTGASADSRFNEPDPRYCAQALVQAADRAMYSAKRAGRARVYLTDISDAQAPHAISSHERA